MDGRACPSAEQLKALLGDRLSGGERDRVAAHVESCPKCQDRLDSVLSSELVASWPHITRPTSEPSPDPEFLSSLHQLVSQAALSSGASVLSPVGPDRVRTEASVECPASIGAYEIMGEIARGGMAVVYKARQPHLGRIVAVKRLRFSDQDASDIERFFREAEAVARLHHPNIVQVYQVGEDDGRPFLALEYVPGPTLADYLNGAPVDPRSAAECLRKVASAVHHAHKQGIIHRDLKPANVLLEPPADTVHSTSTEDLRRTDAPPLSSYEPRVTDFGLARQIGDTRNLTLPDMLAGTPAYLAPEQLHRHLEALSPACDVYALGAILYEMLTGRPPLMGPNVLATLRLVETAEPVPPRRLQPHLPRDLESACLKCLAKDPHRRYSSAADLAADLGRFLDGKPTLARPLSLMARIAKLIGRHPWGTVALVLFTVAALGGLAGIVWQWREAVAARGRLQIALGSEAEQRRDAEENLYFGRLAQATILWENGDASQARDLLAACRPSGERVDLRGWEWHYLSRQFRPEAHVVELRHWVNGLAPIPGNVADPLEMAVAVGRPRMNAFDRIDPADGRAAFLSLRDPTMALRAGPKLPGAAMTMAVHPSGEFVAWGTNTGDVVIVREASGEIVNTIKSPAPVMCICFASTGALLVTCDDAHLRMYDPKTGRLLHDEIVRVGSPWVLAAQTGGPLIACGGWVGVVRLYDVNDWQVAAEFNGHAEGITSLGFAPDGSSMAVGCKDGSFVLWDVNARREIRRIQSLGGPVYAVAYRADGNTLAVAGADRTVRVYNLAKERLLATYRGHESSVRCLAFAAGGERLLSGGQDGTVRVWDATKDSRGRLIPFNSRLNDAAFCSTPNGLIVVAASGTGSVTAWSIANGRVVSDQTLPIIMRSAYPRRYMAFMNGGTRIVGIDKSDANSLIVCNSLTGELLDSLKSGNGPVQTLAVDHSGRLLTWATAAGEDAVDIHWRDPEVGLQPASVRLEARTLIALAIDPANNHIAALTAVNRSGGEQSLWVVDTSGASPPREVARGNAMFGGLSFSADGNQLAVSVGEVVQVYRTGSWKLALQTAAPPTTTCLVFSPDGRRLAAVGYDGNAMLLSATSGKRVFQLQSLARSRTDAMASDARVAFSPDGSFLLSTNWDGSINVWDGSPISE
jgi:serine/threonine protein kinase/WD40 repeat protein